MLSTAPDIKKQARLAVYREVEAHLGVVIAWLEQLRGEHSPSCSLSSLPIMRPNSLDSSDVAVLAQRADEI